MRRGEDAAGGRAQSSPIAVVLLLAMVIAGAGAVVGVGSMAIENTSQSSELARAEHSMTVFDARAAMVGLGETSAQSVSLGGRSDGRYEAASDAGWLRVTHRNYTGEDGDPHEIYNESLGSVTYTKGDSTVAYQGGGVWRHTDGETVMVSPPEFHYRDATLTLPVIRVLDDDAASGSARALIDRKDPTRRVYPNATTDETGLLYPNGDRYRNPVENGTVSVTVHSEYYEGWASYFRTRTTGNVSVNDTAETATVVLKTVGSVGGFTVPSKGDSLDVRGKASGHAVEEFEVDIAESGGTFNNMRFSFYAKEGARKYEVLARVNSGFGGGRCEVDDGDTLSMWVLYEDGNTETGTHVWSNTSIPADSGPVRLECDDDGDAHLVADYMSDDVPMEMNVTTAPKKTGLAWDDPYAGTVEFNHTGYDEENETLSTGDTQRLGELNRHYIALMGPSVDLTVYHGGGNRGGAQIDGSASNGALFYDTSTGSQYVTYLHITENNVSVSLR